MRVRVKVRVKVRVWSRSRMRLRTPHLLVVGVSEVTLDHRPRQRHRRLVQEPPLKGQG